MSKIAAKIVGRQAAKHGLDARLGFALLRNRQMPVNVKLLAVAIGVLLTALLLALELPLDAIVAFLIPGLGLALDFAVDGLEVIVLPLLFASIAMLRLAPKPIAAAVRANR